jgi:hypothetical protein
MGQFVGHHVQGRREGFRVAEHHGLAVPEGIGVALTVAHHGEQGAALPVQGVAAVPEAEIVVGFREVMGRADRVRQPAGIGARGADEGQRDVAEAAGRVVGGGLVAGVQQLDAAAHLGRGRGSRIVHGFAGIHQVIGGALPPQVQRTGNAEQVPPRALDALLHHLVVGLEGSSVEGVDDHPPAGGGRHLDGQLPGQPGRPVPRRVDDQLGRIDPGPLATRHFTPRPPDGRLGAHHRGGPGVARSRDIGPVQAVDVARRVDVYQEFRGPDLQVPVMLGIAEMPPAQIVLPVLPQPHFLARIVQAQQILLPGQKGLRGFPVALPWSGAPVRGLFQDAAPNLPGCTALLDAPDFQPRAQSSPQPGNGLLLPGARCRNRPPLGLRLRLELPDRLADLGSELFGAGVYGLRSCATCITGGHGRRLGDGAQLDGVGCGGTRRVEARRGQNEH